MFWNKPKEDTKSTRSYHYDTDKAFPNQATYWSETDVYDFQQGMDLRDYFAAKVLQGYATRKDFMDEIKPSSLAARCYELADLMMKERSNGKR